MGFFKNILKGLKRTRDALTSTFDAVFSSGGLNDDFYEELEFALISSDIGASTSAEIIENLRQIVKQEKLKTKQQVKGALKNILVDILQHIENEEEEYPFAMLVIGVNGVGKTTTIGKMANYYKKNKKEVVLVAGDTFRAAAAEQLSMWAKKTKVRIIKQNEGADPAAVVFDGVASAKAKKTDVLLIDTAGRLHNKVNLMKELEKVSKIVNREWEGVNYKKYIVIDATTGQNGLSQAREFNNSVGIDGIILTKLDGTAKGGIVINIINELKIPIKFIGVGEGVDDLEQFDAKSFVDAIL